MDPADRPIVGEAESFTIEPFVIKDCALAALATGVRAQNLRELRDGLLNVHSESIYYHFWGELLRPRFDDPEYNNGFASWVGHALNDTRLAEKLGVIDPADFDDLESLRQELVEVVEQRIDEVEYLRWAGHDQQFHFTRAQIVVFDTRRNITHPRELATAIDQCSLGSIYYHVIDARHRNAQRENDFSVWLGRLGERYASMREQLRTLDPYFVTLAELRRRITVIFEGMHDQRT